MINELKNKNFSSSFVIFFIISILYLICNLIWWYINTPIILYGISAVHFLDIFEKSCFYRNAPLITWIMKLMFSIFGKQTFDLQIIFINYIFFLISLIYIYKLGVKLKNKETGNIAMVLFALTPAIYGMSRFYGHQDYHLVPVIIFNIYALLKTDDFKNVKWSILYGISIGIGLLIKDSFLGYFFVPWVYVIVCSINKKNLNIINAVISVCIAVLMSCCHYFRLFILEKLINEPFTEVAPIFDFNSIRIVTISLWEDLLSIPIFLVFIVALVFFLLKYKNKNKLILILWIVVPWLIVTFMPHHKKIEYFVGFVPAIILISSIFLTSLNGNIKRYIIMFVVCICVFQYFDFSYKFNILNISINFGKYNIKYYNIENRDIISFDKSKYKLFFELFDYIKTNYKDKSVYFISYPYSKINSDVLKILLTLDNIKCNEYRMHIRDNFNSINSDVVIVVGDFELEERVDKIIGFAKQHPEIYDNNFINKEMENMSKVYGFIFDNYILIDSFYLNNINEKENKISIYKYIQ